MGVHGLTSYLEQSPGLGRTVVLLPPQEPVPPAPLIVDFYSFAYTIPVGNTVRGGEYEEMRSNVRKLVEYWRTCNLAPEFVIDGPSEHSKFSTVLARAKQTLSRNVKYMAASDAQRAKPRTAALASRLPKMTQAAVVDELRLLQVPVHFAQGEADAATAELAQARNGYMVSNDSDYFVFPADCLGYVPISSILYGGSGGKQELAQACEPTKLQFKVYRYRDVAAKLGMPPASLPVFAALAGNDHADYLDKFTLLTQAEPRFNGKNHKQVLPALARELAQLASLAAVEPAELHETVLEAVLPRLGTTEPSAQAVARLVASAASYDLKPVDAPAPGFPLHPQPALDSPDRAACRALYLSAFERGELSGTVLGVLKYQRVIRPGHLEMHDRPSPGSTLGGPVRRWIYALLADAFFDGGELAVTELARQGTELVTKQVAAENIHGLIEQGLEKADPPPTARRAGPLLLAPFEYRRGLFLLAFGSATPALSDHPLRPLLLALRHIHQNITDHPWSEHEYLAAILTAHLLTHPSLSRPQVSPPRVPSREHIQRSAELLAALSHVASLAEALLVVEWVEPAVHRLFDGRLFHGFMMSEKYTERVVREMGEGDREEVLQGLELVSARFGVKVDGKEDGHVADKTTENAAEPAQA